VTQDDRDSEWYWGRFSYPQVMLSVEKHYAEGAAAVTLEQITEEQFYEQMPQG
jgi:hypothetical protein